MSRANPTQKAHPPGLPFLAVAVLAGGLLASPGDLHAQVCQNTVVANVVALDQPFWWNRLGAFEPQGMIYALRRDVETKDGSGELTPGNVKLRSDKRPRPLTLRVNVGDCLQVNFQNLLADPRRENEQPATREASVHVIGMQLVGSILSDGSFVGENETSLAASGETRQYTLFAEREGIYLLYSTGAQTGGESDNGQMSPGLFGAVNVEPAGSEWYRSQLTRDEMDLATVGTTPAGQPILDYDATYPAGHKFEGLPILNIRNGNEVVHSDLTAIITGPGRGFIGGPGNTTAEACAASGTYPLNKEVLRNRCEPFREFTLIFHDEIGAIQAFPAFNDPVLKHTLHSVRDGFAINYGTGGIGAEIVANRVGVGPMWACNDCKYEEFFLTSWAVGDPAMIVDVFANATDGAGNLIVGPKATKALYPDDPSNTYHSYISDHVKMRNLHAGKEHHIFHLHAHQWLYTPDSDESSYLDSQAIGPGAAFTYEMVYDGSGNRNKTPGDAIFHCHFYPHFAQGMWALWRNHDVFEQGTEIDPATGAPAAGARALPDGEIAAGTPIPGLVPLPGKAMAPMPTETFPGYPFYIAGLAGHRPPHPPLDLARDETTGELLDGGLPRHVVQGGVSHIPPLNRLDFDKVADLLDVVWLPEDGTALEQNAMAFHAQRQHATFAQPTDGSTSPIAASFVANGLPGASGAPYADPCVDDFGQPIGLDASGNPLRRYKAAGFQIDAKYTKGGWHFPQHRMLGLNEDVEAFLADEKPPEPFYFRANSNDCIEFWHTNLLPHVYELDDFQVKTPTDVLGQHIHLVKFDVTSSDGSANGFNYEDGTFAPGEVRERIHAIRAFNGCAEGVVSEACPEAEQHPAFPGPLGLGAQTTIQRWWADPVLNNAGKDRTLRTVYTHDHYAPSTQQQAGFYAGLLIEPTGSQWFHSETGVPLYTRDDGGPTSWQVIIATQNVADSYREFMFSQQDFALGYTRDAVFQRTIVEELTGVVVENAFVDPAAVINPPAKKEIGLPFLLQKAPLCPGGVALPCPEAISAEDPGFMSLNYRSEPVALRVRDPGTNTQAGGLAGDLSHVFRSELGVDALGNPILRADPDLNVQPDFYPPLTADVQPGDPFTPLMRAYENDRVTMRVLVGAQEEGHNWRTQGVKWLFEPSWSNSGYRNAQMMGISEHFEFEVPAFQAVQGGLASEDYLNMPGAATDDLWTGVWNLLRAYNGGDGLRADLAALPSNPDGKAPRFANPRDFNGVCPRNAPIKKFAVLAVTAQQVLPGGTLVYNPRENQGGKLHDPTAILYVHNSDIDKKTGLLKSNVPVEPIVLRANAGDCITLDLENRLPAILPDLDGFSTLPMIVEFFNNNEIVPSSHVGLNVQLLAYDVARNDGTNVGLNPVQTAAPAAVVKYQWYAGDITVCQGAGDSHPVCAGKPEGFRVATPVEFGVVPLVPSDRIKQQGKGAIGALVIEPQGATWTVDSGSRASATVTLSDGTSFREFVVQLQDDVNLRRGNGQGEAVRNLAEAEDPEDSGQKGLNYRTEPMWKRIGFEPNTQLNQTRNFNFSSVLSNDQLCGGTACGDPVTPVFTAQAGTPIRFRVVESAGKARNHVFTLHGHVWEQLPWTNGSTELGFNGLSEWKGSQEGIGAGSAFNFLPINGAGGKDRVPGDYLYRDFAPFLFDGGIWGILRVTPSP